MANAKNRKAFTLIEMMVVIALIAILSLGVTAIRMSGTSQTVYTAQRQMMAVFQEARLTAVAKQTEVRIIIYRDHDNPAEMLRRYGVIYKTEEGWIARNDGGTLPEGVFFVPPATDFGDYVEVPSESNFTESDVFKSTFNNTKTNAYHTVDIAHFPSNEPQMLTFGAGKYYSYTFNSNALSMNPCARIMLAPGLVAPSGKIRIGNTREQAGFVVLPFGQTVPFNDYGEMEDNIKD